MGRAMNQLRRVLAGTSTSPLLNATMEEMKTSTSHHHHHHHHRQTTLLHDLLQKHLLRRQARRSSGKTYRTQTPRGQAHLRRNISSSQRVNVVVVVKTFNFKPKRRKTPMTPSPLHLQRHWHSATGSAPSFPCWKDKTLVLAMSSTSNLLNLSSRQRICQKIHSLSCLVSQHHHHLSYPLRQMTRASTWSSTLYQQNGYPRSTLMGLASSRGIRTRSQDWQETPSQPCPSWFESRFSLNPEVNNPNMGVMIRLLSGRAKKKVFQKHKVWNI